MTSRPLEEWVNEEVARVGFLFTDIDDTVTEDGMLPAASLAAMEALSSAGIKVVPVTGRPAGWCDHIARMWPVDAVIGENGALFMAYDRKLKKMHNGYAKDVDERARDRVRLNSLQEQILQAVPGTALASDQPFRIADLAIDFCEDVSPLPAPAVQRIVELFENAGATAKVSSIHVNGWFGVYDKLSMTERLAIEVFDMNFKELEPLSVFAGDSPNDQPMFARFHNSVGVANVVDFELQHSPRWITNGRGAKGFQELAQYLIKNRL